MRSLLGEPLRFDWKVVVVTVSSTLLLIVDAYHQFTSSKAYDSLLLFLVVPLLIVLLIFRESPAAYGFRLGNWKTGLLLTLAGILIGAPIVWFSSRGGAMHAYYASQLSGLPWNTLFDLFGWEFFFRGFMLFAYARRYGPDAIWLQAVPFALAHIGKPEIETLSTIFGGFLFGWIAWRTRSFLYAFLIHWFVNSFAIVVAAGALR
ncbi:MAG TPA: CPBP family intramembrane glutamic endopeptidase [Anaerolineales bacterium]|nr:CPBP family intramembrane glutamic endopeptidase [Anaerolineales bacterium]